MLKPVSLLPLPVRALVLDSFTFVPRVQYLLGTLHFAAFVASKSHDAVCTKHKVGHRMYVKNGDV